jgi:hypothetical protein
MGLPDSTYEGTTIDVAVCQSKYSRGTHVGWRCQTFNTGAHIFMYQECSLKQAP